MPAEQYRMGHRATARQRHCVSDRVIGYAKGRHRLDFAGVDRGPRIALVFVDESFRSDCETTMESKTGRETKAPRRVANDERTKNLVEVLDRELDATFAKVRKLREEEEAIGLPADRLEVARSLEEIEMNAGLIERCEDKLRAIDDAFNRLKRGRYGICEKCNQEIPIQRLRAVPLAAFCLDCENKRNDRKRPGEGDVDESSRHLWTPP